MKYNHKKIEKKWQKFWDDNKTFKTNTDKKKEKCYVLDMFPYPSGSGLHVGHPLGYTATDIYSRFKRLNNFNVLHPIGWDAFGLPAEQYALKTGTPARVDKRSIIFDELDIQPSTAADKYFSFDPDIKNNMPQVSCHIKRTTTKTHQLIRDNLD